MNVCTFSPLKNFLVMPSGGTRLCRTRVHASPGLLHACKQSCDQQDQSSATWLLLRHSREKVQIICVDLASEVEATTVKSKERGEISLLSVWKNALELFVRNKSALNSDHEFAIVILKETAHWYCDFLKDPNLVCKAITSLQSVGEDFESFDTASLYSIIYENCRPPPPTDNPVLPPPFVVRAILLFGRSHSMPVYRGDVTAHDELCTSPYFFLDVLYSHEPPSPRNLCEGIFDILAEMNPKSKALVLDWSFHVTKLFNCFATLLAHPLQRPIQALMDSKLSVQS